MFNLEDFKKYGVAIRRGGRRARFVAHIPDAAAKDHRLLSITDDGVLWFTREDGMFSAFGRKTDNDLIDVDRPMRRISFSVPEPVSEMPKPGDVVYAVYVNFLGPEAFEFVSGALMPKEEKNLFQMGLLYKTVEDAQAACDAIRKGFER